MKYDIWRHYQKKHLIVLGFKLEISIFLKNFTKSESLSKGQFFQWSLLILYFPKSLGPFAKLFSFYNFHNFSTNSACPTRSHQLLFVPGDNFTPWHFMHYMTTTEHWYIPLHCGKLGPYSTSAVWRAASSGLEGFGNFGRLHYRIKGGGHLPYEG